MPYGQCLFLLHIGDERRPERCTRDTGPALRSDLQILEKHYVDVSPPLRPPFERPFLRHVKSIHDGIPWSCKGAISGAFEVIRQEGLVCLHLHEIGNGSGWTEGH